MRLVGVVQGRHINVSIPVFNKEENILWNGIFNAVGLFLAWQWFMSRIDYVTLFVGCSKSVPIRQNAQHSKNLKKMFIIIIYKLFFL